MGDVGRHQSWPQAVYLCREGWCQVAPGEDAFEIGSAQQGLTRGGTSSGTSSGRFFSDGKMPWGYGLAALGSWLGRRVNPCFITGAWN
jgi:hypothetical protein